MAERSPTGKSPSRPGSAASDPAADLRRMIVNLAEIQIAGLLAGAGLWKAWIDVAAGFGERAGRRSMPVTRGEASSDPDTLPRLCQDLLSDLERCARELTQLPRVHGLRFYAELQRIQETSRPA